MDEKEIQRRIAEGRSFLGWKQEGDEGFVSDQDQKKPQPPLVKEAMRLEKISLPTDFEALNMQENLYEVIRARKSSRVFTEESISLLQLSWLLWACQGIRGIRGKSYATLRTVPSGGARHGFETYLIVNAVQGLEPGRYHYLPMEHSLEYLGALTDPKAAITETLHHQAWAAKASVVFYWSIVPYRCEWRYGIHAHRVALIDAGHVAENLYLACSAIKLGTCAIAAFDQELSSCLFELDGQEEFIVYTEPVGTISEANAEKEQDFYRFVKEAGL